MPDSGTAAVRKSILPIFECADYIKQWDRKKCCPYKVAPEQKARLTYDNILRLSDDPDVNNVIRFLREREIVHFQRFGEAIELAKQKMDQKNVYFTNPAFDK